MCVSVLMKHAVSQVLLETLVVLQPCGNIPCSVSAVTIMSLFALYGLSIPYGRTEVSSEEHVAI